MWLWAIIIAILGAVAGSQFNLLVQLNGLPRLPIGEGTLGLACIMALVAVAVAVASLVGVLLGGLAGMRFHRKVDKTGLGR